MTHICMKTQVSFLSTWMANASEFALAFLRPVLYQMFGYNYYYVVYSCSPCTEHFVHVRLSVYSGFILFYVCTTCQVISILAILLWGFVLCMFAQDMFALACCLVKYMLTDFKRLVVNCGFAHMCVCV